MPSRILPLLCAAAAIAAAPAAQAQTRANADAAGWPSVWSSVWPFWAGTPAPTETRHPGLARPPGLVLRWGALGPDRDGGVRFGARLTGPGGTWTLDHSDGHRRGRAAHRFRLGFSRRF